jgi:serine protease
VSPISLNFGTSNSSLTLTAQNFGSQDIPEVTIIIEEPWIEIDGSFDVVEQKGDYTVTVYRDRVPDDGPYSTTVLLEYEIESSLKQTQVSVNMQKGIPTGGDAGYHYVLLLDPDTFATVAQFDVAIPINGLYPFSLSAPPGDYILFAGTDSDNDYHVGDPGESSGAYISIDQPRVIRLNRDRSGFNFTTSFNINLGTTLAGPEEAYEFHVQREGGFRIDKY